MPDPSRHGPSQPDTVYLLDAVNGYETAVLEEWLERLLGSKPESIRIPSSRRNGRGGLEPLARRLQDSEDLQLVPARLVWMPPRRRGRRSVTWTEAFKPGDPRDPRRLRAMLVRALWPDRVKLAVAPGASAERLSEDHRASDQVDTLARYVTRRAWRALDLVERRIRGNRYKVPRFVPESILSRGSFRSAVEAYARQTGTRPERAHRRAERYLHEMAATHSPYVIDMIANAIHSLYRQGYGEISYDPFQVAEIAELGAEHPVAFLPSHRSNMDRLSLQFMLWENNLPPNHTAGGINLNFFPVGPLMRRTGVFFIRRSFRDNDLYKIVLRSYIDYLVEKRLPLEWYMEGGRSRSGKLNPPRYGLLGYVADSLQRGMGEDVKLIPVSIAYDQIQDVPDYAREARGKTKEKESLGWLLRAIRSMRKHYGDIHIRFGEPVSLASMLSGAEGEAETQRRVQKTAFEVMYRIGQVTPITPTALVSIALLEAAGDPRSPEELLSAARPLAEFAEARNLPATEPLEVDKVGQVVGLLHQLHENGYVSRHEALGREVFWLDEEQMIEVSYYRNVVVHFFVERAIAEMALAWAAQAGARDIGDVRRLMLEIRDVLKFEFFFPPKSQFLDKVEADITVDVEGWRRLMESSGPGEVLAKLGDRVAGWAVLPLLDAYSVVADELATRRGRVDRRRFLRDCMDRARMYALEGSISAESVSQVLFTSALSLAENRGLLESGARHLRAEFAEDIGRLRLLAREVG